MLRQPKTLLLAGDWHGNLPWAFKVVNYANHFGVDTILHVGDFGWWVPGDKTNQYLSELNKELDHFGIDLYWIDGNHEYHPGIPNEPHTIPWSLAQYHRITHLPRGFRWEWWDEHWMALGGAHSVDRLARKEGVDWWPEESLTAEQIEYACRPGPVDVIVAHDAPAGVGIPGISSPGDGRKRDPRMFPESELIASHAHRELVQSIVDAKLPEAYYHGHYHRAYQGFYELPGGGYMRCRGLDKDNETVGSNTLLITEGALRE